MKNVMYVEKRGFRNCIPFKKMLQWFMIDWGSF